MAPTPGNVLSNLEQVSGFHHFDSNVKVKVLGLNVRETKLKLPGALMKEKYLVHFAFYESFPFHVETIERENSCLFLTKSCLKKAR